MLTFIVSWIFFIGVAILSRSGSLIPIGVLQLLILPGVFTPAFVAMALTFRASGSAGVQQLLQRIFQWQVGVQWFVFAVGYIAAIKLAVAVIYRGATGTWPQFGTTPWYVMLGAILISTPVQAGEEIGWRGYALPRLIQGFGFAGASVMLGVIWACWHLPLFFIAGADTYGQSFPVYVLQVTALSVAMAWLYVRTQGSLLLVMLMHAVVNNSLDIVPSAVSGAKDIFHIGASPVGWITLTLLWICAALMLLKGGVVSASD